MRFRIISDVPPKEEYGIQYYLTETIYLKGDEKETQKETAPFIDLNTITDLVELSKKLNKDVTIGTANTVDCCMNTLVMSEPYLIIE